MKTKGIGKEHVHIATIKKKKDGDYVLSIFFVIICSSIACKVKTIQRYIYQSPVFQSETKQVFEEKRKIDPFGVNHEIVNAYTLLRS